MAKDTIVLYGPFLFPDGDAAGHRVYHTAKMISEAGWRILVIGRWIPHAQNSEKGRIYRIDDIDYTAIYSHNTSFHSKAWKLLNGGISFKRVWERHGIKRPRAIISYSNYFSGSYAVMTYARKNAIPYIADVVEWYSPQQFKLGKFSLTHINSQLGIRMFKTLDNTIVISQFLESFFSKSIPNILRIPATIDTRAVTCNLQRKGSQLALFYAGVPTGKDYLHVIIEGIGLLAADERARIRFDIYGLDLVQLHQYLKTAGVSTFEGLDDTILAYGRVSRNTILKALQDADFTVLLRPQMRYANAGFPSKVPESLAVGTPVLLNYTSDLHLYIRDGQEGIIIEDCTAPAVAAALRRALSLTRDDLNAMRVKARRCAETHFDYRNYVEAFNSFLENAR